MSLGVGDEDDRQFPERIHLRRPDSLLHKMHEAYRAEQGLPASDTPLDVEDIPTLVRNQPLVIKDIVMSKLHSAILTADPVSNLYVCGVGRGGRLGLGDENTQFRFVPVQGPLADKKIQQVALGQNHTLAVTADGELWTWGLNTDSQLGYVLPPPTKVDEEPMCVTPRQVFGPLKKETVLGAAASAIHSVAHTGSSLYCWGRNTGQLALMDSDSNSLDIQQTPRKVAASLLSCPIEMVSAIDKATTCLLSNHTVWVFTNYGYNLVKFPIPDVFANYNMQASYSNRYEPGRKEIGVVASGGDTIAAVNARGDLFTMQLNHKVEASQPATSTTNPVKIKGALTQPHCIWDSRKDGVVSVNVGEHGSVIICTESGAVWRRVKRLKGKSAAFDGSADLKHKNFKFERVPYITNCAAARSSTFGAFAAIRTDSKVMSEEIKVRGQSIWEDIGSLLCLADFEASEIRENEQSRKWEAAIARERKGSVTHEILRSADIEADLLQWLQMNSFQYEDADMVMVSASAPDIRIPVHGFVLAGRSSVLRDAFAELRDLGITPNSESFTLEHVDGRMVLTLVNADVFTMLNIIVYLYQDAMIPVWKYTRDSPSQAYRFRQVRTELMKFATKLNLPKLEAAARLQIGLETSMDLDFQQAIKDHRYFEDGDVIIELDGAETMAHSQLLCQRCPFFKGMFHGRSRGQWLAGRRDQLGEDEKIRVDLSHISPDTFDYVIAFLYGDVGTEMFNDIAGVSIDDFSELVLDVMAVSNELMLDRLSQACQYLIGKFVTTRNIANLLNVISACSVTDFKDTGLEYICLQLESMLENHLLEDLDEDLLHELDEVVRDNQLARFPFARSGRADLLLHEKYPDLATDMEEERRVRVRELAYKLSQKDDDRKVSSSNKARVGSLDEMGSPSPTTERSIRKSKTGRNGPFSPSLRPKTSVADMIFSMDDDSTMTGSPTSPTLRGADGRPDLEIEGMPQLPKSWQQSKGKERQDIGSLNDSAPGPGSMSPLAASHRPHNVVSPDNRSAKPWASAALPTSKLDLKNIMSEANSKSALTAGLAAQQTASASSSKTQTKISQKERKKQMQLQAEAEAAEQEKKANVGPWETVPPKDRSAPWKAAAPAPKTSLKETMSSESVARAAVPARAKPLVASEASPKPPSVRTASPDTRFPGQSRSSSSSNVPTASTEKKQKPLVPHSKSYITPARKVDDDIYGASMADIMGHQAREQQLAKEAVAKRSLQEIQQEQEFQQWWDQESRRAQEEEARRLAKGKKKEDKSGQRGRRGRGSNKPRAAEATNTPAATPLEAERGSDSKGGGSSHRGRGGRGKGRKA
jgi:alpha-tubulin suppressor-like RCC1 family protein